MDILTNIIDTYLQQDRGPAISFVMPIHQDKPEADRKFRASDAGKCHLMRYWKRQGKEGKKPDPDTLRVMEQGNLIHAWINQALLDMRIECSPEMEVEDDHIIGHIDAIIEHEGKHYLYDYKTVNGKKWYYLEKSGFEPEPDHVLQTMTYLSILPFSLDAVIVAYINRENMQIQESLVDNWGYWEQQVKQDWEPLIVAWENQNEPKPNPKSWECRFCRYNTVCLNV